MLEWRHGVVKRRHDGNPRNMYMLCNNWEENELNDYPSTTQFTRNKSHVTEIN